jgi:hypothetical protein
MHALSVKRASTRRSRQNGRGRAPTITTAADRFMPKRWFNRHETEAKPTSEDMARLSLQVIAQTVTVAPRPRAGVEFGNGR